MMSSSSMSQGMSQSMSRKASRKASRSESAPFILDLSRLMSRAGQKVPTGIDRVELAYALYLIDHMPERTHFAALHPIGVFGKLPTSQAHRFVKDLSRGWDDGDKSALRSAEKLTKNMRVALLRDKLRAPFFRDRSLKNAFYLLISHHHLGQKRKIAAALRRHGARFVPMVHDLIPLDFPEYARPREPARHEARMQTVVSLADGVIVPCAAVGAQVRERLERGGRGHVPVWEVPHGVHLRATPRTNPETHAEERKILAAWQKKTRPYFVCLGTIEPRKNHLLLLNLWRRMVEERGENAPRLILVGKRGWENENIVDMLERCPALQGVVEEQSALSDEQVVALLREAQGLLFPSFGEGYGLPLAEALALGVPVICSDLSVFREVGGEAPEYLDPLDTPAWAEAIDDFTQNGPRRQAQSARLRSWTTLGWNESVSQALEKIDSLS